MITQVPFSVVEATVAELKRAGTMSHERVVIWLGKRTPGAITVEESFIPEQHNESDYFHIPPEAMRALLARLARGRRMVAAQVHSHPMEAFHSPADNRWAIVRHQDALSFVLPWFCSKTTAESFVPDAAIFRLTEDNRFVEIARGEIAAYVEVIR
jgi:proteasome lid subunit RPN8/RPN11